MGYREGDAVTKVSDPPLTEVKWKCRRKDSQPLCTIDEDFGPVSVVVIGRFAYPTYQKYLSKYGSYSDFEMLQVSGE